MNSEDRKSRNLRMTRSVLNGMTFDQAKKDYGFNSRAAASKAFRLTLVNFFMPTEMDRIKEKGKDIKHIRQAWQKVNKSK